MLAPLLLLWPMSVAVTWFVAQTIANRPYDRELADIALALARQAAQQVAPAGRAPEAVRGELERVAVGLIRADDPDVLYFQVLGRRGEFVAGTPELTVPVDTGETVDATLRYRDDEIDGEPVRVAYMRVPLPTEPGNGAGSASLVQVAQTLNKRSRLATEIVKGVILPQFVILPLAVVLVWLALSRGILPLAELQQRIRRRDSTDLSPISDQGVPEEVAPLVAAINDLLQRLDQTLATQRHFLADAAHQLKTPLAGLRMQAELVVREIEGGRADPQSVVQSLRHIGLSSQRAAHVVNQLLALARAEDTGQAMRRVPVDLAAVTRAVVLDFVPRAMDRGIDLGYEGPGALSDGDDAEPAAARQAPVPSVPAARLQQATAGIPADWDAVPRPLPEVLGAQVARLPQAASSGRVLLAEPVLVGEMVRNLVDNALQYTPRGGSVTVRVLPDPFGQVVVLQVEDTGPGIDPAERERVFQPFYRALGTQVEGSGLGLAIVQEIAQRHGGDVSVQDARPRQGAAAAAPGALFTVRLALTQLSPPPAPPAPPQPWD
jgi:two-component system sensor histidine kinase TctE